MEIKKDLFYTKDHEWVKFSDDSTCTVGITDYAQDALGDIVFISLPEIGSDFEEEGSFTDIESVKAVSDIFSPVTGKVSEVNEALQDAPESINANAYDAWIAKFESVTTKKESLMSAKEYEDFVKGLE